jgi:hypothetical protein
MFRIMPEWDHSTHKHWNGFDIPRDLIASHEAQAVANHYQNLSTLHRRGGLSRSEACAVLEDRPWKDMPIQYAETKIMEAVVAFNSKNL